jgi:FkbM family methyltransferase
MSMILQQLKNTIIAGLNSKILFIRLIARGLLRVVNQLSTIYDPIINYKLNGYDIKLPISHALPSILSQYPYYSSNLARVASCVKEKYEDLTIIDIGANIGDSVFILRKSVFCPILCIEGDERFFEILQMNTISAENVSIKKIFVGDADQTLNTELVIVSGTAHFEESNSKTTEFKKLSSILSEEPKFLNAKMIKIDTDGFDLSIIRGSIDFLQCTKPIIFFEYDPFFLSKQNDDGLSIFPLLRSLGYHTITIYDNFGTYVTSLLLTNLNQIEDFHRYLLVQNGFYYDMCAFHEEDSDLVDRLRKIEMVFLEEKSKALN